MQEFEISHKEFERDIPAFLGDQLSDNELDDFLQHLDACKVCQDELSIQYLVYEGMPRLETGETFNLQNELRDYIKLEKGRLRRRRRLFRTAFSLEIFTVLLAVAAGIVYLWPR